MTRRTLRQLGGLSSSQVVLRVLILLGALGFTVSVLSAGQTQTWGLWVLAVMTVLTMAAPHTDTGFIVILYLVGVWLSGVEDTGTLWAVPAALSLLVVHVACALASTAPVGATIPGPTWRRWALRTMVVGAATVLAWGASRAVSLLQPASTLSGVLGMVVIAAAVAAGYALTLRDRSRL